MNAYKRTELDTGSVAGKALVTDTARTHASALVEIIRRDIITGALKPGERLRIKGLGERYKIGTIPMREALSRLSTTGFVVAEDQRGFRVASISPEELQEILTLRLNLEPIALRESISKGSMEWAAELIAAHYRLEHLDAARKEVRERGERESLSLWDTMHNKFHAALLGACGSRWLMQFVTVLTEQMNRYRHLTWSTAVSVNRDISGEHKAILDAALNRDAQTACALLERHLIDTVTLSVGVMRKQDA